MDWPGPRRSTHLLAGEEVSADIVLALGGPPATPVLGGEDPDYWLRVWALRGLLWLGPSHPDPVITAL